MKRKFLVLLCIVALIAAVCSSCDLINGKIDGGDECEHTYSEAWSSNSTEHWHAATCEHTDLKSDVAKHTDEDQNGKCDVCNYEIGHTHTFADTWTSDATHHWKNATCPHTEEKSGYAAHVDSDTNGYCDACNAHVHVVNAMGMCAFCGQQIVEVDPSNLGTIIPIIVANSNTICGGIVKTKDVITDLELDENDEIYRVIITTDREITYQLGSAAAHYSVKTDVNYDGDTYSDVTDTWYEILKDNTVFGVCMETYGEYNSGIYLIDASDVDLVGYEFFVSNLMNARGAENLLAGLYELSQSNAASAYTSSFEDGVYSFSFNYTRINTDTAEGEGDSVDYYELTVSFTGNRFGALATLDVKCDCYTNSVLDELDIDYTYDPATKTVTLKDTAVADVYTFSFAQNMGDRTYVSEHPKSSLIPESFDFFLDEDLTEKLGESVTVTEGDLLTLYLGNFAPEGSDGAFIVDTFACDMLYGWGYDSAINFMCTVAGTYEVEFTLDGKTYSFDLVVEAYIPEDTEQPENTVRVEITDTYAFFVDYATFTAPADGDYTFTIAPGVYLGAMADSDNAPWADFNNTDFNLSPVGGSVTVSLKAGETYEFTVSSPEKGVYYIPYTVSDYTGSGDQGGNGEIEVTTSVTNGKNTVVFSEEEIANNTAERTLTVSKDDNFTFKGDLFVSSIVDSEGNTVTRDSNYQYALVSGKTYTVTFGMFNIFGTSANTSIELNIVGSTDTEDEDEDKEPVCAHVYEQNTFYHPELVAATCTTPGVAVFECINCEHYYTEATPIDPDAHAFWGDSEVVTAANCATQTNGLELVSCVNDGCTATNEVEISYLSAHDWSVETDTEATCTEDGAYSATCTLCGEVDSYDRPAEGHFNWYLTCGETGECMACGNEFTKPDHQGDPATCTTAMFCYNCFSSVGEPLGHDYVDGVCSVCGGAEGSEVVGDGTDSNPYVLTEIPTTLTFEGAFDVYYTYTAEENCVITITYSAGAIMSISGADWDKDEATSTYTLELAAGTTVILNPWASNPALTYTYEIAFA